ncbi:MAG: sulfite exporter TauE/SafE family protein [Calditrichia bacterium]|nr:sulfite exporter TauE/SafE family protein [Calditrichia bacterium]
MILTCFIILLTGISVGLVSTIFGIGGGIIMVPLLSLILPFSHLEAIATSLATIVLVAGFNTFNFSKQNVIVWNIVPWIAVTSSFFAFISARLSTVLPENILVIIFLLFLFYFAIRTFLISKAEEHSVGVSHSRLLPLGIGTISGLISGVTGIGGGGITTPMTLVTGLVKNVQAAPTSNAIMIFTAFFASLSFAFCSINLHQPYTIGYIHLDTAILLFLGSALVSRIGVSLNHKIPLFWRKTFLGMLLLFICVRLILLMINS